MRKKAPRKLPVTKQVWQWTENVTPEKMELEHILTAYRLRLGKCKSCRKNCNGNPLCLRGIGESTWLRTEKYRGNLGDSVADIDEYLRKDGEFVGLKNLGATCYVNTFLQLWFHNQNFRKAVYSFREKPMKDANFPYSACGHLQLIFGLLQSSQRKNIDPSPFVKCLGLDTDLQQDAQEFSKLLLNLLDQSSEVGKFLCQEFCGEYEYCTTCKFCNSVSRRPSTFYELDLSIQGHNSIRESLKEFLMEEVLEKENQYYCEKCNCRRDASRQIVIKTLPRTLNLQLLRFVFDKTTWTKRKISKVLSFPDTLDLSSFISSEHSSNEANVYDLTAVLIHRGPSAFSGHYIAHIKDASSGLWHKFNDEDVVQLKSGKKLDLDTPGSEDYEIDMPQPPKRLKLTKNSHSSKDAYMLVYTRQGSAKKDSDRTISIDIPDVVNQAVQKDNDEFLENVTTMISDVHAQNQLKSNRFSEISTALKKMFDMDLSELLADHQWVPFAWLKHMLSGVDVEPKEFPIDKFLCSHEKLDPMKVFGMKCVPKELVTTLSRNYNPFPTITDDLLCYDCVRQRCNFLRSKKSLLQDHEEVMSILKDAESVSQGVYIGKSSLRYWRSIVLKKLEDNDDSSRTDETTSIPSGDSDNEDLIFNEDLLCEHGNLTTDIKIFRIIPLKAWNIIYKYFPEASVFKTDDVSSCSICINDNNNALQETEIRKLIVGEQKIKLADLFYNKRRPEHQDIFSSNEADKTPAFFIVPRHFVNQWRKFIQAPSKHQMPSAECSSLLCPHGKLQSDPTSYFQSLAQDDEEFSLSLIWPAEWEYISKHFTIDVSISVIKKVSTVYPDKNETDTISEDSQMTTSNELQHNGFDSGQKEQLVTAKITCGVQEKVDLEFSPEVCKECLIGKQLEREHFLKNYKDKEIFVKKILHEDKSKWLSNTNSKDNSACRKSMRTASRGEKPVTVSSDWTLKQLKIKIMGIYSIPPFDQNLWLKGQMLSNDEATLGNLSIVPGSLLFVLGDEPDENALEMLPVLPSKGTVTEEGFKGTSLLGT